MLTVVFCELTELVDQCCGVAVEIRVHSSVPHKRLKSGLLSDLTLCLEIFIFNKSNEKGNDVSRAKTMTV